MEENLDTTTLEDVETEGSTEVEDTRTAREKLLDDMDSRRDEVIKSDNIKFMEESGVIAKEEPKEVILHTVRVKIDGEEMDVPYDEVLNNYQKTQAADKRLRDASIARQQLEAERTAFEAMRQQMLAEEPASKTVPEDTDDTDDLRLAVDSIMDGDTDTAVNRLKKLLQTKPASTPAMDEEKVVRAVEQKLAQVRYTEDLNRANELFLAEYEDLNNDEALLNLVNVKYQAMLNEGVPPVKAAKEAGDATREWLHSKIGKPATVDTATRQDRKQSLTSLPQATARTKSTITDEPDDASSVIANMRKGRPALNY